MRNVTIYRRIKKDNEFIDVPIEFYRRIKHPVRIGEILVTKFGYLPIIDITRSIERNYILVTLKDYK